MSERFIKFIPSEESMWLLKNHPNAMSLLMLIATRARWHENGISEFELGECHIGDHEACGLSRQEYRTALKLLTSRLHVKMIENCRTRQKSTTGTTTYGTKVKLISTNVYDINLNITNHRINQPATTDQPPTNHEQRKNKKEKNVKEQHTSVFDFLKIEELNIDEQAHLMGLAISEERLKKAVDYAIIAKGRKEIRKSFMATVVWHAQAISPPEIEAIKPKEPHQHQVARGYLLQMSVWGYKIVWEKNIDLIQEGHMIIPLDGSLMQISLNRPVEELQKDLKLSLEQAKIKLKSKKIVEIA